MWYGQDIMLNFIVWDGHVFLKLSATGRSPMVVSFLHKMQVPNNCFTLSLCDSNSCKSNCWRDDHVTTHWYRSRWWRSWCHAGDDGNHDDVLEMEIKGTRWWWPYHVTYFWLHMMFIFYTSYFVLIDGSIIRWSLTKFQDKKCSPWVCTVTKVRGAQTPRDDRVW